MLHVQWRVDTGIRQWGGGYIGGAAYFRGVGTYFTLCKIINGGGGGSPLTTGGGGGGVQSAYDGGGGGAVA